MATLARPRRERFAIAFLEQQLLLSAPVINLAKNLGPDFKVKAVRLDSGDLLYLSREARRLLDQADLRRVELFASGGLDEKQIAELLSAGAPIDGFGVGSSMGVSSDAPVLDIAYKLCEYAGQGRLKLSTGKPVLPGRKQVFRMTENERNVGDVIARADEKLAGRALLVPVMHHGERLKTGCVDLESSRKYAQQQIALLPTELCAITQARSPYPVVVSQELSLFQKKVKEQVATS